MNNGSLHKLFEPITFNGMTLRNRIVMPPMHTGSGSSGHEVTDQTVAYYRRRAEGGVGLIIVEFTAVDPGGLSFDTQLGIYDDHFVAGFKRLAAAVHEHGAKIALQIHHGGARARAELCGGETVAPSSIDHPALRTVPRELTLREIEALVEAFGQAARRAKEAGFDMVEIHGAHGYLVNQFLSPWYNHRADAYGGDFEKRLRFALEVTRRVRQVVGPDFPVGVRVSGEEIGGEGLTLQDTARIAAGLVDAGVDVVHVSVATLGATLIRSIAPMAIEPGFNVYAAAAVKRAVRVPVIAVGRINDPHLAESVLRAGQADLVAFGRALMADPDLPVKAAEGRFDEIRKCYACLECYDHPRRYCSTNPEMGREATFSIKPATLPKTVWVIGGGVAGLEAATLAARRGHRVTLLERSARLGGQIYLAATAPHKAEIMNAATSRLPLLSKFGVEVVLGTEVTADMVRAAGPDAVILAAGSRPWAPPIPGIDRPEVVQAWDVLAGKAVAGPRVAVLGGGVIGVETAEYLADHFRSVTVIEMLDTVARDMANGPRAYLMQRLQQLGVQIITGAEVEAIGDDGVVVKRNAARETIGGFQTIVLALGNRPNNALADALRGAVNEVYVVGDAAKPGKIMEAIRQAADVALAL